MYWSYWSTALSWALFGLYMKNTIYHSSDDTSLITMLNTETWTEQHHTFDYMLIIFRFSDIYREHSMFFLYAAVLPQFLSHTCSVYSPSIFNFPAELSLTVWLHASFVKKTFELNDTYAFAPHYARSRPPCHTSISCNLWAARCILNYNLHICRNSSDYQQAVNPSPQRWISSL